MLPGTVTGRICFLAVFLLESVSTVMCLCGFSRSRNDFHMMQAGEISLVCTVWELYCCGIAPSCLGGCGDASGDSCQ